MSQLEHEAEVNMLRRSKESQGYIYPTLVDKATLEVIDGKHRKEADPNWPELQVEFKTPKDRLLYRIHANMARREVSRKERGAQLAELALMLEDEGVPKDRIAQEVVKRISFFASESYVLSLLPSKYKAGEKREAGRRSAKVRQRKGQVPPPPPAPQPTGEEGAQPTTTTGTAAAPAPTPTPPKPKPKPITTVTCPFCHVESGKVLCSTCWRDIEVKEIMKQ